VVTEDPGRQSSMKIYDLKDALAWGKKEGMLKPTLEIKAPRDHNIQQAVWGALDKTIYYCTDQGRLLQYDIA